MIRVEVECTVCHTVESLEFVVTGETVKIDRDDSLRFLMLVPRWGVTQKELLCPECTAAVEGLLQGRRAQL